MAEASGSGVVGLESIARRVSRRGAWLFAIGFTTVMTVGILGYARLRGILADRVKQELTTILRGTVASLELWAGHHTTVAEAMVLTPGIREATSTLARQGQAAGPEDLLTSPAVAELRAQLNPMLTRWDYHGWVIIGPDGRNLASNAADIVGLRTLANRPEIRTIFEGRESIVTGPFRAEAPLPQGGLATRGRPTMLVATPIRDERDHTLGVLAFRIRPEDQFSDVLQVGRMGASGETYAFDRDGLMVSQSRFEDQLRQIGLLPEDTSVTAVLNVNVRDPGGNLLFGYVPRVPRPALPLTHMAASAITEGAGINVDGYRDYRGVEVVGAWAWLPEFDLGVTAEVDRTEAFRGLIAVQNGFWALITFLMAGVAGLFFYSRAMIALAGRARHAERIGQYQLKRKLGEGGMAKVYLGYHALLRRPTAVKLIDPERASPQLVARFEREAQHTSRLNHPNTIALYDYGRTPERVFYYAMEYLDGITLEVLINGSGPLSDARAIFLLQQVCGSLAEAHAAHLVHRDVKPGNIMVGVHGGLPDFVKVLDFGLVRDVARSNSPVITQAGVITGTPMYMSPEAIQDPERVDSRSDIYALGAVAYFLLTGTPPFQGKTMVEVCGQHLSTDPEPMASRLGRSVSPELEAVVRWCLAKDSNDRPQTVEAVSEALQQCPVQAEWTRAMAATWWADRNAETEGGSGSGRPMPAAASDSDDSGRPRRFHIDFTSGRTP